VFESFTAHDQISLLRREISTASQSRRQPEVNEGSTWASTHAPTPADGSVHVRVPSGSFEMMRVVHGVRVYLASRFARQPELKAIAAELTEAGAVITSRWLTSPRPLDRSDLLRDGWARHIAEMDFSDLCSSDACIAFTEHREQPQGRGGRHAEVGIALGRGVRVILVGPREHAFHCLPGVEQYDTWREARSALLSVDQELVSV
jgi:hypothetical protein